VRTTGTLNRGGSNYGTGNDTSFFSACAYQRSSYSEARHGALLVIDAGTRVLVGLTGASGVCYGIKALEILSKMDGIETHLIITASARRTISLEDQRAIGDIESLADFVYPIRDIAAGPASGSFHTLGMIVAPCSIRTLSAIANSYSADLLTRAADVTLKERRPLVLMVREAPLHLGHLRLMERATEQGAIIFPPVPAFYSNPVDIEDIVAHSAARALEQLGLQVPDIVRWSGADNFEQR